MAEVNANIKTLNTSNKQVGQAFRYLGELSSSNDCNNCIETGFYAIATMPTNGVSAWTMLLVFKGAGGGIHQMSFAAGALWTRSYTGSPLKWTTWTAHHNS